MKDLLTKLTIKRELTERKTLKVEERREMIGMNRVGRLKPRSEKKRRRNLRGLKSLEQKMKNRAKHLLM
jgi:hypothetical protein